MFCKVCHKDIEVSSLVDIFSLTRVPLCSNCFDSFPHLYRSFKFSNVSVLSLYCYEGIIKELIYNFKGLRDYELKDVFLYYYKREIELRYFDYTICFAPSFEEDDKERGFNHVEAMFECINLKKEKIFIKTSKYKQSSNSFAKRNEVKNVLKIDVNKAKGLKKILIVDDVFTSGNTIKTLVNLAKSVGIKHIKVLTISKTTLSNN